MKRLYLLVTIASLQIILGSLLILQAAQPVRASQDALVAPGEYYHFEFGVLGSGRLSGNLSELQGRPFDLFLFDDPGYASFRDGSNAVPPLFQQAGTDIVFDVTVPGPGPYHLIAVDLPSRGELRVHLEFAVLGLKPMDTIVALIVLLGGLSLMAASLMLSVSATRRGPPAAKASAEPSRDSSADLGLAAQPSGEDPPDDDTRIY